MNNCPQLSSVVQQAQRWEAPLPLSEITPRFIEMATALREALAAPLARQHELSPGALTELGLAEYKRVLGHPISAKHWNRIFDQTVTRSGADADFVRLEIYLPSAAFKAHQVKPSAIKRQSEHRELDEIINNLENRLDPTAEDRAWLFDAAFAHYERLAAEETAKRELIGIKASLVHYLFSALPRLSSSELALDRLFRLNLTRWRQHGRTQTALNDMRRLKSGNFCAVDFSDDLKKIRDLAIQHDGNESLAYRRLRQAGELSQEFVDHFSFDPRQAKSYVPRTVRDALRPEVEMCLPIRRGPWEAKMRGPYISRDWSDVAPGDYFSGDDVTWNHYFKFLDDAGQWQKTRGECLILTDLRTGYPLDFLLIAGHYNSEHIRSLILKVHDTVGLPHKGFYFEQSVWKARFVPGLPRVGCKPLHWRETELGLQNEGISLDRRHATTPRAKPIEGLLHIIQDRMRCIPGFIGFNERTDAREREQDQLARMARGDLAAIMSLPTQEQWVDQIRVVLDEFAQDPQNGKMLPGISPAEGWKAGLDARPLRKLPEEARYLFATHKQVVRVRQEGVILTVRGQRMLFCGERFGELIGQELIAFYNIECPGLLTLSDMSRQTYFSARRLELPAMTASREQLSTAHAQVGGHRKPAKAIFGNIRHSAIATITRDNQVDEATKDLGRFHQDQVEQFRAEKSANTRKLRQIQMDAASLGVTVNPQIRNVDRVQAGIEWEKEIRERLARKNAPAGTTSVS
jgi:hypothetical protein